MSPPTKELMKLTLEQGIAHSGHPVLRWMMEDTPASPTHHRGHGHASREAPASPPVSRNMGAHRTERLGERFNIREIAFDRWGAVQMVQNLEGMGFTQPQLPEGILLPRVLLR